MIIHPILPSKRRQAGFVILDAGMEEKAESEKLKVERGAAFGPMAKE